MASNTRIVTDYFQSRYQRDQFKSNHRTEFLEIVKNVNRRLKVGKPECTYPFVPVPDDNGRYSIIHIDDVAEMKGELIDEMA